MKQYIINYNQNNNFIDKLMKKKERIFKIKDNKIKVFFIPINHTNIKLEFKYSLEYLNDLQIEQLNNLLYKHPDSCFYEEIKSYDSIMINQHTVSTNYNLNNIGNLFIFDSKNNVIGYLSYQFKNKRVLIENVCIKKEYRGKGIFKVIFNWFLENTNILYKQLNIHLKELEYEGFMLTVWKESPFNKNNEIVEIYKKFGFVCSGTEDYSDKRTYIHMKKNLD